MGKWQEVAQARKLRRHEGRRRGTEALQRAGVAFHVLDRGWHLRMEVRGEVIDYTPGTGTWRTRSIEGLQHGVRALLQHIKESSPVGAKEQE